MATATHVWPFSPTVDPVMAAQRAASFTTRSIKKDTKMAALKLAISMVDLTTLEGADTPEKVRSLCRKGVRVWERDEEILGERLPPVAAICVYPSMVSTARDALSQGGAGILPASDGGAGILPPSDGGAGILPASDRGADILPASNGGAGVSPARPKIASVATGFPSGQYPLNVRIDDTRAAIAAGADEIDMVINRGAFLSGRYDEVAEEIREIASVCAGETPAPPSEARSVHLKVILETGELATLDHVRRASDLAIAALSDSGLASKPGAAFIKTSTGKVSPAATMPVTLVMLEAIRDHAMRTGEQIGMKPAGGIRAAKQAVHYLVMVLETMGGIGTEARWHGGTEGQSPWLSPSLFRFGASSLANDLVRQIIKQSTGTYVAAYDVSEA